jgi:prophage regulatory protein
VSTATHRAGEPLVLRRPDVVHLVGLSAKTIVRWVRAGTFPPPVKLGPQAVGWLRTDVDTWLQQQAAKRPASAWTKASAPLAPPEARKRKYPARAGQGTRRRLDAAQPTEELPTTT